MVGYSGVESLDDVRVGEYLMCCRGPWIQGTDARGRVVSRQDRTFEGSIIRVTAINPPIMLVMVYPMPCGDPNHDHTPYPALIRWHFMEWSRVNRRYLREYMKAANHTPAEPAPRPRGVVTQKEFDKMLEDVYKNGGNYEGPIPGFPPPEDDDDNLAPTHE